ncbi:hypothetical protein M3Y94_00142700 [Aphelenchoides besseyi]|nr:hypothetical protein M3Y94_00142700 [Aphelenchoides besseyi]
MRVGNNDQLITLLPLIFWLFTCVEATRHRHQRHGHQVDFSQSQNGFKSKRYAVDEPTTELTTEPTTDPLNFAEIFSPTNKSPNLFREYMSRGLYQCATKQADTIHRLQLLIKAAYEEYAECQTLMRKKAKSYPNIGLEAFDELMGNWETEDAKEKTDESP